MFIYFSQHIITSLITSFRNRNHVEIVRMVKGFITADKHGVAIPANWPNNELVNDEVIIPPASTVKDAEERPKKYDSYDWWFCHKKI